VGFSINHHEQTAKAKVIGKATVSCVAPNFMAGNAPTTAILQGTLTVSSSELNGLFVVLNNNLPNAEDVTINWTSTFVFNFETFASGTDWILTRGTPVDTGTNLGTWSASATPLPATLPLFATGLGGVGLLGWRKKRKAATAIAAT
jgi:hypothetical protein